MRRLFILLIFGFLMIGVVSATSSERIINKDFNPSGGGWLLNNNNSENVNCIIDWGIGEDGSYGYASIIENAGTVNFSQIVNLTGVSSLTVNWYHYGFFWYLDNAYIRIYIDNDIIFDAIEDSEDYPELLNIPVTYDGNHTIRIELHGGALSSVDMSIWEMSAIGEDDILLSPTPASYRSMDIIGGLNILYFTYIATFLVVVIYLISLFVTIEK